MISVLIDLPKCSSLTDLHDLKIAFVVLPFYFCLCNSFSWKILPPHNIQISPTLNITFGDTSNITILIAGHFSFFPLNGCGI